jgi:hypothetical protein
MAPHVAAADSVAADSAADLLLRKLLQILMLLILLCVLLWILSLTDVAFLSILAIVSSSPPILLLLIFHGEGFEMNGSVLTKILRVPKRKLSHLFISILIKNKNDVAALLDPAAIFPLNSTTLHPLLIYTEYL